MKKEYIISRIEGSHDSAPYIYIALSDPNDYKGGAENQQNPFGPNITAFTSPEDLMKNLLKALGNISREMGVGGALTDSPTFKISMREYEDIGIKVGDKVLIEFKNQIAMESRYQFPDDSMIIVYK
jgi:hypothetical protein